MVIENKELDIVTDIVIPTIIVILLFLINGFILYFIFKKRQTVVYEQYDTNPEEPTASQPFCTAAPKATTPEELEAGIEMERL